jgi:hypothetical protein
VGLVVFMVEDRNVYRVLMGKPEGKKPLWNPGHRLEGNIIMNLKETARSSLESVCLACDKDQCEARVNSNEHLGSTECWEYLNFEY